MSNQTVAPNQYQIHNNQLHISYTTSGLHGKPHFHYQDATQSKDFSGDEIRTETTDIGTLISVRIHLTVDFGSTSFSVLLPNVNLRKGQSVPINAVGITTIHRSSLFPPLNHGQTQLYTVTALSGAAHFVES
jgi:hypothetical protein